MTTTEDLIGKVARNRHHGEDPGESGIIMDQLTRDGRDMVAIVWAPSPDRAVTDHDHEPFSTTHVPVNILLQTAPAQRHRTATLIEGSSDDSVGWLEWWIE